MTFCRSFWRYVGDSEVERTSCCPAFVAGSGFVKRRLSKYSPVFIPSASKRNFFSLVLLNKPSARLKCIQTVIILDYFTPEIRLIYAESINHRVTAMLKYDEISR